MKRNAHYFYFSLHSLLLLLPAAAHFLRCPRAAARNTDTDLMNGTRNQRTERFFDHSCPSAVAAAILCYRDILLFSVFLSDSLSSS
jgi:hypothetical protein